MSRPYSPELKYVVNEALDSAEQLNEDLNSLHLFFALYMLENSGGMLLEEEGYSEERLLPYVDRAVPESKESAEELMTLAEEASVTYRSAEVNCLHLLVAFCRHRRTFVFHMMERAGLAVPKLRNRAVSLLVNGLPRRYALLFDALNRRRAEGSSPRPQAAAPAQTASAPSAGRPAVAREVVTRRGAESAPEGLRCPVLREVAVDLTARAQAGELEPVEGRDRELRELVDILNKRKANNPLIIGPPGVGKTALVEGLAYLLVNEPEALPGFANRRIYKLEPARLMKGTQLRGSFSERIDRLRQEVREAKGRAILFLDEIHTVASGSVDGSHEIADELKAALSNGEFPCIGATTTDEYKKTIEKDPALSRRFHVIELAEPDEETTLRILASLVYSFEEHHAVQFAPEALKAAVRFSNRYMRDRCQPDKSLTILDLAGSRARREGLALVDEGLVAQVVSHLTGVPKDQLALNEAERYLNIEERLAKRIVGHRYALDRIADALRRNAAGFGGRRPMGSFLFAGPTGVGKTEIARALAEELFGSRDMVLRFDMSEFSEAHSTAKLIGAPPGYVGFAEGGLLADSVRRRPFQILLFDEFEKAHPDVHQLLLQVLDDGRLTDNLGRVVDFSHTVIILTSNLGNETLGGAARTIGFATGDGRRSARARAALAAVQQGFSPELYNRIDEKIVFTALSVEEVRAVAELLLSATAGTLDHEQSIKLAFDEGVPQALIRQGGYDARFGARPMRRLIQSLIEAPLANLILQGKLKRGDEIRVVARAEGEGFDFQAAGKPKRGRGKRKCG